MRRIFLMLCGLCTAMLVLSSCLGSNDDDVTLYDDTAITGFTLGTLNRYLHTTSSTGTDSVYKTTVTGSSYPFTIDQIALAIYNTDSLPVGTDAAHVLLSSITTKNSGVVYVKSLTSDSLTYASTSDSIDFTSPRTFRVYAIDGSGYRDYTVTVNVRQQEETTGLAWTQQSEAHAELPVMATMNACWWNGGLTVLCTQWDGYTHAYTSADGQAWQQLARYDDEPNMGSPVRSTAVKDGRLYVLYAGELLRYEADGTTQKLPAASLSRLLGASTTALYGVDSDGQLVASADDGLTWTPETLDESASLLPQGATALVSFPYSTAAETDYVLLVGYDGETPRIWRKINEYGAGAEPSKWVYMDLSADNHYPLPPLTDLSLAYYDDRILAIGREGIYVSRDQGITWKTNSSYTLPDNIGAYGLAAATDTDGRLWLTDGSWQTWRSKTK